MGNFLLTVESGAICYRQGELGIDASGESNPAPIAKAVNEEGNPAPTTCTPSGTDATDCEDGCALDPGDVVYLPVGSTVTQSASSDHAYGTPGSTKSAIVVLIQFGEYPRDQGPCGGTCH